MILVAAFRKLIIRRCYLLLGDTEEPPATPRLWTGEHKLTLRM